MQIFAEKCTGQRDNTRIISLNVIGCYGPKRVKGVNCVDGQVGESFL